jgi:hypothetical protein
MFSLQLKREVSEVSKSIVDVDLVTREDDNVCVLTLTEDLTVAEERNVLSLLHGVNEEATLEYEYQM